MNSDPTYERLRAIAWRRPLTPAEVAELEKWLQAHPERAADLAQEAALDRLLLGSEPPRVSTNFTPRVWQKIEAESQLEARPSLPRRWRVVWWPRLAWGGAVGLVLVFGGLSIHRHQQRLELARTAQTLAQAVDLSDPVVLADFEVIRRLNSLAATADENLLALSEELLAVAQ